MMTQSMFEIYTKYLVTRTNGYQEVHTKGSLNVPSHAAARPPALSLSLDCYPPLLALLAQFCGRLAKVISGLNKFDADLVTKVARAAAAGGGTHIDIACDPELVRAAKAVSNVPVSL